LEVCFASDTNYCFQNPTNTSCSNYVLPSAMVNNDITMLCGMMGNMSGCAINTICSNDQYKKGVYCAPFSIYKSLCKDMMMKPCDDYSAVCVANSAIRECNMQTLPLPSSMALSKLITDICADMSMPGCEQCTGGGMVPCDVLTVYSDLCLSMPDMNQCADWHSICALVPTWPICTGQGSSVVPEMKMYFHTGILDYVLFKEWVPRDNLQYASSCFAIFLLAVLFDFFRYFRTKLEQKWARDQLKETSINEESCHEELAPLSGKKQEYTIAPFRFTVDIPRALLQFVETGWSLLLMLVAMTFNVGLFFALCAGSAVGTLIFARFGGSFKSHH